jgi:5-methyltetrahydrofolate--homocysteine methyltransferase
MKRNPLAEIEQKILILDGATGTQLQKRGMPAGVCPETWCLKNPDILAEVHGLYRRSGADIVFTATLGTNRFKLGEYGESDVAELNRRLASLARKALPADTLVAGDIGPTGRFVEPFGDLAFEDAVNCFKEQVRGLLEGGVDLFVIETMFDIQEARAALLAVKELCDLYTMVTMTFDKRGTTLNGTDPLAAMVTLQSLGAQAVGCNCSTGPAEMIPLIKKMKPYARVPLAAKPNAGMPILRDGKTVFPMEPTEFASYAKDLALAGANMLGGCCGTTPEHVALVSRAVRGCAPVPVNAKTVSSLSSSQQALFISPEDGVRIIGERINPTGKKQLQQELSSGNYGIVQRLAREQARDGASLLDVNAGMPGIDETSVLLEIVKLLAIKSALPLVIDSSSDQSIEKALRLYPGRALINSLSGEKHRLLRLLPVIRRYGAMTIVLPVAENNIPHTAGERVILIRDIVDRALAAGLAKEDLVIDGLVMTISAQPGAALETLRTIHWCRNELGCLTVIGLSNVSFGMPVRPLINSMFLTQAAAAGLNFAIANPCEPTVMQSKLAADLLAGKDKDASAFLGYFSRQDEPGPLYGTQKATGPRSGPQGQEGTPSGPREERRPRSGPHELSAEESVTQAVIQGDRDEITPVLQHALKQGLSAETLINDYMIPAITRVGDMFEEKKYFLPQLMASAETMKRGFALLEPLLKQKGGIRKGTVLLATVEGDIHDIGKNIVSLMLGNHGFKVVDLGKDVGAQAIIEQARVHKPDVIGLSALMTTTMVKMKEVIILARENRIDCPFLLGGAVVSEKYARSLSAYYADDGVEAVRVVTGLLENAAPHKGQ